MYFTSCVLGKFLVLTRLVQHMCVCLSTYTGKRTTSELLCFWNLGQPLCKIISCREAQTICFPHLFSCHSWDTVPKESDPKIIILKACSASESVTSSTSHFSQAWSRKLVLEPEEANGSWSLEYSFLEIYHEKEDSD